METHKAGAAALLRRAQADFRALRGMLDIETFEEAIFGFHAQQAVEKALKAWLHGLGHEAQRTHDLTELFKALRHAGADITPYLSLVQFTLYAVQARYEEGMVTPDDPLDRPAVVAEVGGLLQHVASIVGVPDIFA
jgi:HEPN domain-containing protein